MQDGRECTWHCPMTLNEDILDAGVHLLVVHICMRMYPLEERGQGGQFIARPPLKNHRIFFGPIVGQNAFFFFFLRGLI